MRGQSQATRRWWRGGPSRAWGAVLLASLVFGGCQDDEAALGKASGGEAGGAGQGGKAGGAGGAGQSGTGGAGSSGKGGAGAGGAGAGGAGAGGAGAGGAPAAKVGTADKGDNGQISLNEKDIRAVASGGKVEVTFVVQASGTKAASGMLSVSLRTVDDTSEVASTQVAFQVAAGGMQELKAQLPLPSGITSPSDWVRSNVRITDGTEGGLRVTRSLLTALSPYEVTLTGPATVAKGKPASYRVRAQHPTSRKPIGGAKVGLTLKKDGAPVKTLEGTTAATGEAVFELSLDEGGAYQIEASAQVNQTSDGVGSPLSVKLPGSKVLLTTDKPIYQPGQVIHLRALALAEGASTPLAAQAAVFEVEDGKGNKIFKRSRQSDDNGIASTDFTIGSVVNTGTFKVRAQVGEVKSEKTVNVSYYALPKFKVSVQTDKPWYRAGEELTATVDSAYFFGKPVAGGDVTVEAATLDVGETVFQTVQAKLDGSGKTSFVIKLPSSLVGLPLDNGNALINLRVKVVDAAKQEVKQERLVTVSQSGVDLALVPESTSLVPGVENHIDLFAADPLGSPLPGAMAKLMFPDGTTAEGVTDDYGHIGLAWTPPGELGLFEVSAQVKPPQGGEASTSFTFNVQNGKEHVVLRTDKAVYALGEQVAVEVRCTKPTETVYVDWINAGQTVDMRTIEVKDGGASFTVPLDATVAGSNRLEAYVVDDDGNIVRSGRTFFARGEGALSVSMATDKPEYAPGEPAKVTFSVKDEGGNPQVAALGVQVVDEAVYALVESKPGLLRTYFELEDSFSKPQYEIHGPGADFSDLLLSPPDPADPKKAEAQQKKAGAAFAAMGDKVPQGLSLSSGPQLLSEEKQKLDPAVMALKGSLGPLLMTTAKAVEAELSAMGCTSGSYYCADLGKYFIQALSEGVVAKLALWDFWGNAFSLAANSSPFASSLDLRSSGPDELAQTQDDVLVSFPWGDLGVLPPWAGGGGASGAGGAWAGGGGAAGGGATGGSETAGEGGPRVRKDFPETLYVNPALITGPDGTATVEIPMADSITTWRVSSLANAKSGKLGGGQGGIKVFQDFFTDVAFPAQLTRGDEVTFPVAVYNYLSEPQTVSVQIEPGDWYTPLGQTTTQVDIGPGEVKGVQVPVRVEKVGVKTLTVKAIGAKKSDAVARMVRVVPDGKEIVKATSGSLSAGQVTLGASFPPGAVEGSPHLHLDVYPAYLSQVVSGMDSLLQVPQGCFEQTTSTTWPNVLVLAYMKQTGQLTAAIQMKAESLISAGYQRLLTFEHPGGGFSWFGTQDPKPFLSVTAFGVMEFGDMAKVAEVDPAMIQRTAQWLLGQQQPDGSWLGDQTEFFSFQTSAVRNTAFTAWALSSAGFGGPQVDAALGYVKAKIGAEEDVYTLGLAANAFAQAQDPYASQLLDELEAKKVTDGDKISWSAQGTQTDFYGQGKDADVASTALIAHAMLTAGGHGGTVNGALQFLVSSRDAQGNFGSTQATIWSLRTLLLAASKGTEGAVGALDVAVDGSPFTTVQLTADQPDVMHTVDLSSLATSGDHQIELSFVGKGKVSYNLVAKHNVPWQGGAEPPGPVAISVSYDKTTLAVNETVTASVTVSNTTEATENMLLVTLGIPPGFEVAGEDLDAYKKQGTLSNYETTGKQLTLYVPKLAPKASLVFAYRLRATLPIKAEDGGAKAYPYYQPEATSQVASTSFVVN